MDGQYNQWPLGNRPTEAGMKRQRELASAHSGLPLFGRPRSNFPVNQLSAARQPKP